MNALLDPSTADRLAKLCGMFGSNHDGERASAAAMADSLVRRLNMTWHEVISSSPPTSSSRPTSSRARPCPRSDCSDLSIEELFHYALLAEADGQLNSWERRFLINICGRRKPTERQIAKLRQIVAKVLARRAT